MGSPSQQINPFSGFTSNESSFSGMIETLDYIQCRSISDLGELRWRFVNSDQRGMKVICYYIISLTIKPLWDGKMLYFQIACNCAEPVVNSDFSEMPVLLLTRLISWGFSYPLFALVLRTLYSLFKLCICLLLIFQALWGQCPYLIYLCFWKYSS